MSHFTVIVGNIGMVYSGQNETTARRTFVEYRVQSETGHGRASSEPVALMRDDEPIEECIGATFPEQTATVWDARGFPHVGTLSGRDREEGTALYYFPGDFIAGEGFEVWLDPVTADDAEMLADYLSCDDAEWSAIEPEGE